MNLTGLDPEFFVVDGQGFLVPSERILPTQVVKRAGFGEIAVDNAAIELRPHQSSCLNHYAMQARQKSLMLLAIKQIRDAKENSKIPKLA